MRLKSLMCLSFSSLTFILSLLAGCGAGAKIGQVQSGMKAGGREVALGERFKLNQDEKVWVKDTALTVELKGARHTWYVDGKSETVDADLIISSNEKEQRKWMDIGEKLAVGDYSVELWGADPF